MNINYGGHSLNLDTIHGPSDLMDFINSILPQDELVNIDRVKKLDSSYLLFDECTPKEIALHNLSYMLGLKYKSLKESLFPQEAQALYVLKKRSKVGEIILPAVDTEEYAKMQKVAYVKQFIDTYVSTLIQARVGFGLHCAMDGQGKVYVLRDLRELHGFEQRAKN